MEHVKKTAAFAAKFVVIVIIIVAALRILSYTVLELLPDDIAMDLNYRARRALGFVNYGIRPSAEVLAAEKDHKSVVLWITQSLGSPDSKRIPMPVQELLVGYYSGDIAFNDDSKDLIPVPHIYIRFAQLSHSILHRRIAIDQNLSKSYTLAQVGAMSSILIGLITTVLVALSSSELGKQQSQTALVIRTAALIFPALGTALAAIIAFYDPSGKLARQSQVASGLQQIHVQMSNAVWDLKPIAKPNDPIPQDITARLDAWTQRYQELIASLGDNRATPDEKRQNASTTTP